MNLREGQTNRPVTWTRSLQLGVSTAGRPEAGFNDPDGVTPEQLSDAGVKALIG